MGWPVTVLHAKTLEQAEHERQRRVDEAVAENERRREEEARRPKDHRALRPCPDCGFSRTVLVRYWREPDGSYREGWPKRCGVCAKLARARHYERLAAEARAQAAELQARRGRHLQRKIGKAANR